MPSRRKASGAPAKATGRLRGGLLGVLGLSCAPAAVLVERHSHPESAREQLVGHPPPGVRVEHVASRAPSEGCRWVDGQWVWVQHRWEWLPGGWVLPSADCYYAPPRLRWAPAAVSAANAEARGELLYHTAGAWYSALEGAACSGVVDCPGGPGGLPYARPSTP